MDMDWRVKWMLVCMLFATTVGNILTDDTLTPGAKADDALPKVVPAEPTGETTPGRRDQTNPLDQVSSESDTHPHDVEGKLGRPLGKDSASDQGIESDFPRPENAETEPEPPRIKTFRQPEKNEVENLYDDDVLEKASATTPPSQIEATPLSETADVTATLAPPTTQSTPTQEQNSDPEMQGTEDRKEDPAVKDTRYEEDSELADFKVKGRPTGPGDDILEASPPLIKVHSSTESPPGDTLPAADIGTPAFKGASPTFKGASPTPGEGLPTTGEVPPTTGEAPPTIGEASPTTESPPTEKGAKDERMPTTETPSTGDTDVDKAAEGFEFEEIQVTTESPVLAVDLSEHDMPAFAEWKKEFYENDTKHNGASNKVYEPQHVDKKPVIPSKPSSTEEMRNYASSECGSKVISSNKEAQKQQAVLNENRDEYIMQPCSARKWLVIELCEPVLIRRIDMANLELFSSTFENFTVYISRSANGGKERQGKDWHSIGTFHAKEERAIQGFNIDKLDIFTSFVKIEVQSHYGNEHYCPITIIRVYGIGVDDDDDDSTTSQEEEEVVVQQEEAVPSTQAPPTKDQTKLDSTEATVPKRVFPPQPKECYKSFISPSDVPKSCSEKVFHTKSSPRVVSTATRDTAGETLSSSHVSEKLPAAAAVDKPCGPDDAPLTTSKPASNTEASTAGSDADVKVEGDIGTMPTEKPAADGQVSTSAQNNDTKTVSKQVKTIPIAETAGTDTSSSDIPTQSEAVEATQTNTEPSEDGQADQPDEVLDLPLPPTLAEPPTAAPPVQGGDTPVATTTLTPPANEEELSLQPGEEEVTADAVSTGTAVIETEGAALLDPPPPANRYQKRNTAISKLSNQVKALEQNLQVTNRYLEEMSTKSKNQKDDLQRALNHTMRSLQDTTKKLDTLKKDYSSLKESAAGLSEELSDLRSHIEDMQSVGWTIPAILATLVVAVLVANCSGRSHRGFDRSISREEIERVLEDMPDYPLHRQKRSGSDADVPKTGIGTVGHEVDPPAKSAIKKTKSYATFDSAAVEASHTPPSNLGDISSIDRSDMVLKCNGEVGATTSHPGEPLEKPAVEGKVTDTQQQSGTASDYIEIISPTHWRSFDTPDMKSTKGKKKRKSKTKGVKSLFASQSAPGPMGLIHEQEPPDLLSDHPIT